MAAEQRRIAEKYQKVCIRCGNGMLVLPWGAEVPEMDRWNIETANGYSFPIHRTCMDEGIRENIEQH